MDSITTAKDLISKYFSDCDGAMIVRPEKGKSNDIEVIVFYHNINTNYQKRFSFQGMQINVKVYRTSHCSFLAIGYQNPHIDTLVNLLSQGTIIKDYNHEVETIMTEAQQVREKRTVKNVPMYKRIESSVFSLVCL